MIIALTGLAGSGKSTIASYWVQAHGFTRLRFAGPLEDMLRAGFGLSDRYVDGDLADEPCRALAGQTPRQAMQALDIKWGRKLIHPAIWTAAWTSRLRRAALPVVADDLHRTDEAAALREVGGLIIRVVRTSLVTGVPDSDIAHAGIEEDFTILNTGGLTELHKRAEAALREARRMSTMAVPA